MLRGGVSLNLAKKLVSESRAELNTQKIVDKTKTVIQNAAEATKNMAAAAKEKIYHPTAASDGTADTKPDAGTPVKKGDHRITSKQVAGGECNVGFGPQVGVGDKMHDRADRPGRVDEPPTRR